MNPCGKQKIFWLLLVVIALFVCGMVMSQRHGQAMTGISISYYYGAHQLAAGKGFIECDGTPNATWPPLYPLVLAALYKTGMTMLQAGIFVNCLCFVSLMLLVWVWSREYLKSDFYAILMVLLVGGSFQIFRVYVSAYSESTYLAFTLFFAYFITRYYKDFSRKWLIWAAVFCSACWMTRYVGFYLVGLAGLFICITCLRRKRYLRLFSDIAVFGIIAAGPMALWMHRCYVMTGTLCGPRTISITSLSDNLWTFISYSGNSFLGDINRLAGSNIVTGAAGVLVIFVLMWIAIKSAKAAENFQSGDTLILASMAVAYGLTIVYSASTFYLDTLSDRLLTPFILPAVMVLGFIICRKCITTDSRRVRNLLLALLACMILFGALRTVAGVYYNSRGLNLGCNSISMRPYEKVKNHKSLLRPQVFSNNSKYCAYLINSDVQDMKNLNKLVGSNEASLVIFVQNLTFHPPFFADSVDIGQVKKRFNLQLMTETPCFQIYSIKTLQQ